MLKHILFVLILILGGYYFWSMRPITHGPGEVAPNKPVQKQTFGNLPIDHNSFKLIPVAEFDIEARVLSKKRYYSDKVAELAAYDFVVGWGAMSDEEHLSKVLISQSDRSFDWEIIGPPIPVSEMRIQTANIRPIASTDTISDQLEEIRIGHVVRMKGFLVNIESDDGWTAKTSLSRNDIGYKATEIIWVKELTIL